MRYRINISNAKHICNICHWRRFAFTVCVCVCVAQPSCAAYVPTNHPQTAHSSVCSKYKFTASLSGCAYKRISAHTHTCRLQDGWTDTKCNLFENDRSKHCANWAETPLASIYIYPLFFRPACFVVAPRNLRCAIHQLRISTLTCGNLYVFQCNTSNHVLYAPSGFGCCFAYFIWSSNKSDLLQKAPIQSSLCHMCVKEYLALNYYPRFLL